MCPGVMLSCAVRYRVVFIVQIWFWRLGYISIEWPGTWWGARHFCHFCYINTRLWHNVCRFCFIVARYPVHSVPLRVSVSVFLCWAEYFRYSGLFRDRLFVNFVTATALLLCLNCLSFLCSVFEAHSVVRYIPPFIYGYRANSYNTIRSVSSWHKLTVVNSCEMFITNYFGRGWARKNVAASGLPGFKADLFSVVHLISPPRRCQVSLC